MVATLVLAAGLSLLRPTPPSVDPEPSNPAVRTVRQGEAPPELAPLPEARVTATAGGLSPLAQALGKQLVSCELPAWVQPEDYGAFRPGQVKDGVLYQMVGRGPSQRVLSALPRPQLSYTLEQVREAMHDTELRLAILAEFEASVEMKQDRALLGALVWEAPTEASVGGCEFHPADSLIPLVVYVQDGERRLVDAFVKAGETGVNSSGGTASLDVVTGREVRVTASSALGSASTIVTPGRGSEVELTLSDGALPSFGAPKNWDAAVAHARSELEGAELDALLEYDAFVREPAVDPMTAAVRDLLRKPSKGTPGASVNTVDLK